MEINDKPIRLTEVKAIRLVKERAIREGRSAANAAHQTIIEALGSSDNSQIEDTAQASSSQ